MRNLKQIVKRIILEELRLVEFTPDDICDDDPLFGPKFGLDSIDAIELVHQLKKNFGVEIKDMTEGRPALQTINTLCAFIEDRQAA
jgi:acyl carrier protein